MNKYYTTAYTVDQSPDEVFAAVNNVRGWWSEEIEGRTDKLGAQFYYHYGDVHRSTLKITEFVPNRKVVWQVVDNYFNFTQDKTEWKDTNIVFEVSQQGDKTELRFSHVGLVPEYECYQICSNEWGNYIRGSLRKLITTGQGNPNQLNPDPASGKTVIDRNYSVAFTVDQTPDEVFTIINNVRAWWQGDIDGETDKLGEVFTYRVEGIHRSAQQITELVPGKKVVWHVVDAYLNFTQDKAEWKGTDIVFDITPKGDKTEVRFTHVGLVPAYECYDSCSNAWGYYINGILRKMITAGQAELHDTEKAAY